MKLGILNRSAALIASAALLAGGTLIAGASSAAAANMGGALYDDDLVYRGSWEWNQDPHDGEPGDAFRVTDSVADGWGVEAVLEISPTPRVATTQGHSSPYTSPWATGDLPEGTDYTLSFYIVKNGTYEFLKSVTVTS
ncbi:hypothetical protein ACWDSD_32695 [Streptomyces spiralis]